MTDARTGVGAPLNTNPNPITPPTPTKPTETVSKEDKAQEELDSRGKVNAEESAPIGSVKDAVRTDNTEKAEAFQQVPPTETSETNSHMKKEEDRSKDEAPITSTAQLRDYHIKHGTAPTTEEVERVKKLEEDILVEGSKSVRNPNSAE